jgi:NAD(P)-dependent dehydrogenase (short-subunit alcohol dehydrogenase family)
LDAVIANAGLAKASGQPVETLSLEKWEQVLRVNLTGCFLCAKHAFPELRKTRGSMVLTASTRALQSMPEGVAYSASKGGVLALTHSLAISGGPDIRVNAVSPGWIYHGDPADLPDSAHSIHPVGRVGRHADIASMTAYLISEEAGFITGQNFVVDGGMTRKMIYNL